MEQRGQTISDGKPIQQGIEIHFYFIICLYNVSINLSQNSKEGYWSVNKRKLWFRYSNSRNRT